MAFYHIIDDQECSICLNRKLLYFVNQCLCASPICIECTTKLIRCPFCRKYYKNYILCLLSMFTTETMSCDFIMYLWNLSELALCLELYKLLND